MSIPDELKDALKAINKFRYQANKENIKLGQKKYRDAKREDAASVDKNRTYQKEYYQTKTKPKRDANKDYSKVYYLNVAKPKREALKLLKIHNDVFV